MDNDVSLGGILYCFTTDNDDIDTKNYNFPINKSLMASINRPIRKINRI